VAVQERLATLQQSVRDVLPDALPDDLPERVRAASTHLAEELGERLEDAPPPGEVARRSRIRLWELVRTSVEVAIAALRFIVRMLNRAGSVAKEATERGQELSERARDVVHTLPVSRRARRRAQLRTAAYTGAGFGLGLGIGYLLGSRRGETLTYEPAGAAATPLSSVEPLPGQDSLEPEALAEEHVVQEPTRPDEAAR
jgi:hypothetical protein